MQLYMTTTLAHHMHLREGLILELMATAPQVWVTAFMDAAGHVQFAADSDSQLTKGLACILVKALSGLTPPEVAEARSIPSHSNALTIF